MENKYYMIDTSGLAQVGVALLDKLSDAVGWLATHDTPKRLADKAFIDEIEKSNISAFDKHVLISNMNKLIKEYCNQENVIRIALDNLNENAKPDEVDETFLFQLMDKARLAYSEDFQVIWGKILAEECNNPNSIPKSLLFILEQMDRSDAAAFEEICSNTVKLSTVDDESYCPIIDQFEGIRYWDTKLTYDSFLRLDDLGLIRINFGMFTPNYSTVFKDAPVVATYFDKSYAFPDDCTEIMLGKVLFTRSGEVLCKMIDAPFKEGFFETKCVSFWEAVTKEINNKGKVKE